MERWSITSRRTGLDYWIYAGYCAADALARMHRAAGYVAVRAERGELIFPDAETARICGGFDSWCVVEVPLRPGQWACPDCGRPGAMKPWA
jgi:hypothetical protein